MAMYKNLECRQNRTDLTFESRRNGSRRNGSRRNGSRRNGNTPIELWVLVGTFFLSNEAVLMSTHLLMSCYNMSRIRRKTFFYICENKGTDQLCGK